MTGSESRNTSPPVRGRSVVPAVLPDKRTVSRSPAPPPVIRPAFVVDSIAEAPGKGAAKIVKGIDMTNDKTLTLTSNKIQAATLKRLNALGAGACRINLYTGIDGRYYNTCQLGFEKKKSPFTWNPDNRTIYMLDGKALSIAIDLTGKAWDAFVHAKTRPHAVKGESAVIFERRKEKGSAEEITLIWERPMVRVICRGFEFDKITQTYTAMRNLSVSPEAWEWPYVERARSSSPRHSIRALSPASRVQQGEVIAGPFTLSKSIYSVPPNAGSPLPSGTKLHYGGVIINTSGGGSVRVALQPDALQKLRQHAPKNGKRGASAKLVLSPPTKSAKAAASAPPTCALSWVSEESKNLQVGGISFHARHGAFLQSTVPGSVTATSSTLPVSQATVQGQVICQDARAGDLFTPTLEAVMSESGTFTLTKDIIKVRIGIRMDLFRILCVQYQTLPVVADRATTYTLSRSDGQLHHLTWRKSVFTYSLKMVKQNAPAAGLPYYVSDHSGDSLTGLGSGLERYLTAAL